MIGISGFLEISSRTSSTILLSAVTFGWIEAEFRTVLLPVAEVEINSEVETSWDDESATKVKIIKADENMVREAQQKL